MAAALVLALPHATTAQQNIIAVGSDAMDDGMFILQLGRELRPENRRFGLRLSVDYNRRTTEGIGAITVFDSSGLHLRPGGIYKDELRIAGIWLTGRYAPIRARVQPYIAAGAGMQDIYRHVDRSAIDSGTADGVSWPYYPAYTHTQSWLGPGIALGAGLSVRIGSLRLFGEARYKADLRFGQDTGSPVHLSHIPVTFGVRF